MPVVTEGDEGRKEKGLVHSKQALLMELCNSNLKCKARSSSAEEIIFLVQSYEMVTAWRVIPVPQNQFR